MKRYNRKKLPTVTSANLSPRNPRKNGRINDRAILTTTLILSWAGTMRSGALQDGHEKEFERNRGIVLGSIFTPQLGHHSRYRDMTANLRKTD
jgi:hypothetical protein